MKLMRLPNLEDTASDNDKSTAEKGAVVAKCQAAEGRASKTDTKLKKF